jgi:hypothetical protein
MIIALVLGTILFEYIDAKRKKLKEKCTIAKATLILYERELFAFINSPGRGTHNPMYNKLLEYFTQHKTLRGSSQYDIKLNNYSFHLELYNKNIKYIEDNFGEMEYIKIIKRERTIDNLLGES